MKIYQVRSLLYKAAKYLGDFTALSKSVKTRSAEPIIKRIVRRIYGRFASGGFKFFK